MNLTDAALFQKPDWSFSSQEDFLQQGPKDSDADKQSTSRWSEKYSLLDKRVPFRDRGREIQREREREKSWKSMHDS